jgi:Autotransporter beta-domain
VNGGGSDGVNATAASGDITVNANGPISGSIGGDLTNGIVTATSGNTTINAKAIGTAAAPATGAAIKATGTKFGNTLKIVANGDLFGNTGIKAQSDGAFDITSNNITAGGTGIDLSGAATGTGTIKSNGLLQAGAVGVNMASAGTLAFNNIGTLTAPIAINTTAGVLNVANPGTINGLITTAGGQTNLNNSSVWNAFAGANPGDSSLTNLVNTGTVSMANSTLGTGLIKNNINVTNTYIGASTLNVDIVLDQNNALQRADQLNVANGTAGVTTVNLNLVSAKTFFAVPVLVVQGKAGDPAANFAIGNPGVLAPVGLINFNFQQFAPGQWGVVSTVNLAPIGGIAGGIAGAIASINTGFFLNTDPLVTAPPNPQPNQWCGGPWIRSSAGRLDLKSTATSPFSTPTAIDTATRYAGYQVGADAGVCNINGAGSTAHLGLTAGQLFANSTGTASDGTRTTMKFMVPYFGLYGVFTKGGFSANAQVRRETYDIDVTNAVAGLQATPQSGQGWAFSGTVRYRFDLPDQWLIEPSAAFSHERLRVSALNVAAGASPAILSFSDFRSTLARGGVRVGKTIAMETYAIQPYVQANVWHEFAGNLRQNLFVNNGNVPISLNRIGTFYQFGAGAAFQTVTGWVGFAQADVRTGNKVKAYSATVAIRHQF